MQAVITIKRQPRPRIIVLENSHLLAELLKTCITEWFRKPEVAVFDNGDEAMEELMRLEPDLLMTDRIHAGMSGEELVWRLAAREVRFPILSLSGDMPLKAELPAGIKLHPQPMPFNRHTLWKALNKLVGPCDFPVFQPGPTTHRPASLSNQRSSHERKSLEVHG